MTTELPFLVRHGQVVWALLVLATAALVLAMMIRTTIKQRRQRPDPALYVRQRIAWMPLCAFLAGLAMVLVLRVIGIVALKSAGERPFDDRESNVVPEFHPVAIAAATPFNRDAALDLLDDAGFEREQTCSTRLAHARLDELRANLEECKSAPTWEAYAWFVEGHPCKAADALVEVLEEAPDGFDLALAFLAQASCRRWDAATATASRLEVRDPAHRQEWSCVGTIARRHADPTFVVPVSACMPARFSGASVEEHTGLADIWAAKHMDLFDLGRRPESLGKNLRLTQAITLEAMAVGPGAFSSVRTLERLSPQDTNDLLDPLGSYMSGASLTRPPVMTAFAASVIARSGDKLRPVPRAELIMAAAIGDVIAGDFANARARLTHADAVLATATPADDGPRVGTLEFARSRTARMEDSIRYRVGEPVTPSPRVLRDIDAGLFAARRGETPPTSEFVDEHAINFVRRTLSGDLRPLRQYLYARSSNFVLGRFVGALAPHIRPAPPELLDWVETPRWKLRLLPPADIAWDAAGRRDVLRLLGEPGRASRWEAIARRQWEIASRPEIAMCLGVLASVFQ